MCLADYGASEAVNLCSRYVEKSTKYSEQKCANVLENKIRCSLTVMCESSFRPSHGIDWLPSYLQKKIPELYLYF